MKRSRLTLRKSNEYLIFSKYVGSDITEAPSAHFILISFPSNSPFVNETQAFINLSCAATSPRNIASCIPSYYSIYLGHFTLQLHLCIFIIDESSTYSILRPSRLHTISILFLMSFIFLILVLTTACSSETFLLLTSHRSFDTSALALTTNVMFSFLRTS